MVVHSHNGIPANTKRASHLSVINTWMSPTDMMCVEEGRHTREHAAGSHLQKAQTQAKFFSGVRSRVLAPLGRENEDFQFCFFHLMLIKQVHSVCEDSLSWTPRLWAFFSLALSGYVLMPLFLSSIYLLDLYFTLQHSWLTMLWWSQVDSKGTQPYIYMYAFSPQLPSHPGCHLTLSTVPGAVQ